VLILSGTPLTVDRYPVAGKPVQFGNCSG